MLLKKPPNPPPDNSLTFKTADWSPPVFTYPLSPDAVPRAPRGTMTRRKRVRLRKRYNKLRRLARIGKAQLVVRSYLHGTWVLKEEAPDEM